MNPAHFCTEYEEYVAGLQSWLEKARVSGLREEMGYALEQLLMRRDDALDDALDAPLIARIRETDRRLVASASRIHEAVGVDVHFFLSHPARDAAAQA